MGLVQTDCNKMNPDKILGSKIRFEPPSEQENLATFLREGIRKNADRTLLVDAKRTTKWTGRELLDRVERVATGLIERVGLKPGEVVLTICDHTDNEFVLALGVIFAGGALYGTSPSDGYGEELNYCRMVRPDVIVLNSNLHQWAVKLRQDLPALQDTRIVWIDNPALAANSNGGSSSNSSSNNNSDEGYYSGLIKTDGVVLFPDLVGHTRDSKLIDEIVSSKIDTKRQNVTYLLTSGSTGKPKVVPNTHEELVWALQSMRCACNYPVGSVDCTANANNKIILPLGENSVLAGDLPLDHGAGLNTMFLSLVIGSTMVILPSYQEDAFWQGVHQYRITTSIASTTFAYKLLSRLKKLISSGEHHQLDLSCFRFIACCGSKLAFKDLVKEINEALPNLYIGQAYGCTEIGYISILAPDDCRSHLDSVGNLVPGIVGKIVCPDTGNLLGPNERGQLYLSSKTKFKQYMCLPGDDANKPFAQCHEGEFYKTGDYVHYDEQERLYIHGRMKDTLYLMQDWKILPAELEDVVNEHPLVEYSAVVGVPDPDLPGCDAPRAFVKLIGAQSEEFANCSEANLKQKLLANDRDFIAKDVYNFVAQRTAEPKHLKGGVRILDTFPRNGLLAKVDRKVLRQMD